MPEATGGIEIGFALEFEELPRDETVKLHAVVSAAAVAQKPVRPPINICLVLDRSGSMKGPKLKYTIESAQLLIDHLSETDKLSMIFYDSTVFTVIQPSPVKEKEALKRMLGRIEARGSTNLSGGWMQGLRLVEKALMKDGVNRVLLMTDGLANRGVVDAASLLEIGSAARAKGVVTTTLGFGEGFNEDLLTSIAAAAGGNFHFIRNPDDAPGVFTRELGELMGMAAQNLQAVFRAGKGVRFLGFLNKCACKVEASRAEIYPGDVFLGDRRTLSIAIEVQPAAPGPRELFSAKIEFDDLSEGGRPRCVEISAAAKTSAEAKWVRPAPAPEVALAVALFEAGEAKRRAMALADAGNHAEAAAVLERALESFGGAPMTPDVKAEIDDLALYADSLKKADWDAVGRKSLSASIFRSQAGRISIQGVKPKILGTRIEKKNEDGK